MTANAEARTLLDQLMGADRDAPLPPGAALPTRSKRGQVSRSGGMILPSSKRSKSCYDRDIDPLHCAWGTDVYELFVNTKSDLGPNPYTVDDAARKEYLSLPQDEKERLGFEARLFDKLKELVQHCDRTVSRNKDKLQRELQRQSQKRGGAQDYVVDVNEGAVEELIRTEIQVQDMKEDLKEALTILAEVRSREIDFMNEFKAKSKKEQESQKDEDGKDETIDTADDGKVKESAETMKDEEPVDNENTEKERGDTEATKGSVTENPDENKEIGHEQNETEQDEESRKSIEKLGALALEKQRLVSQIANLISQISPLEDSIEVQHRNLNHVKSDITSDKTVCEVSGNFMSARDADERIAAHYAGKQYVGWKLVRDKLKEMIQKYGKYGPPRPGGGMRSGTGGGGPLLSHQQFQQQQMQPGGREGDRRDSRGDGRWERGAGGGGYDRGGRYDRGGGGYDARRNDRGGSYRSYGRR